jgi:hypothetical protein
VPGDEGVPRELVADGRADGAGASAVDHAELVTPGQRRGVHERANRLARLLRRAPPHVELRRGVGRRRAAQRDGRLRRSLGLSIAIGAEPLEQHTDAKAAAPDHDSLVTHDLDDRPPDAEGRRDDRIAGG